MSRRETQLKSLSLTAVAGVNQRVVDTELPPQDYSNLLGVFPEFAGLQSRIFGKRLLQKYPDSIYGIYQFWTPMGYAGGLYQFDGKVDYGTWITPTTTFDVDPLPPGYDGGGYTLDEFGYSYGANMGYGTPNTCVFSFLNGSATHTECSPPPTPADIPDDNNGGPAGQGKKCVWDSSETVMPNDSFITAAQYGDSGYSEVLASIPGPMTVPLGPDPGNPPYAPVIAPFNFYVLAYKNQGSYWTFTFFTGYQSHQGSQTKGGKLTFDLNSLKDDESIYEVSMRMTQSQISLPASSYQVDYPLSIAKDADGNIPPQTITMMDYLDYSFAAHENTGDGFAKTGQVVIDSIVVKRRFRNCS